MNDALKRLAVNALAMAAVFGCVAGLTVAAFMLLEILAVDLDLGVAVGLLMIAILVVNIVLVAIDKWADRRADEAQRLQNKSRPMADPGTKRGEEP